MTNKTKWIIALPFASFVALILPALVAGRPFWFVQDFADTLYVGLSGGMWLVATAFVDVKRPRGEPDLANLLIPLGLVLSIPVAVYDRIHLIASSMPAAVSVIGLVLATLSIVLGISSRRYLGGSYSPRAGHMGEERLVQSGPYQWIRHPIYAAALLWVIGWPLIIRSFPGSIIAIGFLFPAIVRRIRAEEVELLRLYGQEYPDYCQRTWRLVPFLY